jgi:hypothetical protein
MIKPPFYPIVYVRGYAGSQSEVEDTVATPYMGFNLGSTKLRQRWDREIVKYIFESPLIRLMKDHAYSDVFNEGNLSTDRRVNAKSIWIYRYYESVSKDLGSGERPPIEDYAKGLDRLIEEIRDRVCGPADTTDADEIAARENFKVHLVAHSMGGLISRCYLQNIHPGKSNGKPPPVDKVFTYATPHGGIDLRGIENLPAFLQINNVDNFNEERMREYLNISSGPVNSLNGKFDSNRFFSLVGTNYRDYPAAKGLASAAVGQMSDGLVQIKNACVVKTPRAFVHRSHSGHYGIVNSEEGYQNLRRFLFGDVRVDIRLSIDDISLPAAIEKEKAKGHRIRASYHAETAVRVRGARWDLHRRSVADSSAHFIPYKRIEDKKPVYLYTGYLSKQCRVKRRGPMGFTMDLGIMVPEYEVDRKWRLDQHFEGGYIFRDKINFDLSTTGDTLVLKYGFDSKTPNRANKKLVALNENGVTKFQIPISRSSKPGISATLVIGASHWN